MAIPARGPAQPGEWKPIPDPSALTTDAVGKLDIQLRQVIVSEIVHLSALFESQLHDLDSRVADRFGALEKRTAEQKADTTKALTDALAAQKEAVANQTASSEKSITKSETATTERIKGVEALLQTSSKASDDKINDLKDRIVAVESIRAGGSMERAEHRAGGSYMAALVGAGIAVVGLIVSILVVVIANKP